MPRTHREVDTKQKREAILASARRLFLSKGYEATGMARIAAESGVAPNTLYWYFDDKDALLIAVLDQLVQSSQTELAKVQSRPLHARLKWMLAQIDRVPGLVATVHARASASASVRAWHERFHRMVESAVADDLAHRGLAKVERALAARAIMFVVEGLVSHPEGGLLERDGIVRYVANSWRAPPRALGRSRTRSRRPSAILGAGARRSRARAGAPRCPR